MSDNEDLGGFARILAAEVDAMKVAFRAQLEAGPFPFGALVGVALDRRRRGWKCDYDTALFPRLTRLQRAVRSRRDRLRQWWWDNALPAWDVLRKGYDREEW